METSGLSEPVDGCGQVEILRRNAAGIMGDQSQAHLVVTDIDIRMVAGLFGQVSHLVYKRQCRAEILVAKDTGQLARLDVPGGHGVQTVRNFRRRQGRHWTPLGWEYREPPSRGRGVFDCMPPGRGRITPFLQGPPRSA